MKFSVVIPTYNRPASLKRTIFSVLNQAILPSDYEIVIVDDGSKEKAEVAVSEIKKKYPNHTIRYFYQNHRGSAAAKNTGIKNAKGEIIFFTDDDCEVPANWIEAFAGAYKRHPGVVGVGGWFKPPDDDERFFQRTAYLSNVIFNPDFAGEEKIIDRIAAPVAFAANVSYKRDFLQSVGGFNESISPIASAELRDRVVFLHKKDVVSLPLAVIHHCPLGALGYLKKVFRQGRAMKFFGFRGAFWRLYRDYSILMNSAMYFKDRLGVVAFSVFWHFFLALGAFWEVWVSRKLTFFAEFLKLNRAKL